MPDAIVHVGGRDAPIAVGIGGANPTFHLAVERITARALAPIEPVLLDFLAIACTIFSVDGAITRGGDTRSGMGADWRRRFDIEMQVRCPEIWRDPGTLNLLCETIGFLTEDDVSFRFRQAEADDGPHFLDLDPAGAAFEAEDVILFSGGLDSFAGALEHLSTTGQNAILLSHRSARKVIPRQERLGAWLAERFPGRVLHLHVDAHRIGSQASETTQRSRSFLFTALGAAAAATFGALRIAFFENGIVSHNLPISPQVIGSMATRTTHPLGLSLMSDLLGRIAPGQVALANKYQWMTKTEVVQRIQTHQGLEMLSQAVSCTNVRDQTKLHTHCGACSQCLDRRFAVLAAGLGEHDPEDAYATPVLTGPRETDRSRILGVEWTAHAARLRTMTEAEFMAAFGLELSRILRAWPDGKRNEVLRTIHAMHRRHAYAVHRALTGTIAATSDELAAGTLPASSLLRMWVGATGQIPEVAVLPAPASDLSDSIAEDDLVLSPDGPLSAAFFAEEGVHVVAVIGLGRVSGAPAAVAHYLKPLFDEDRAAERPADQHRYTSVPPERMSKEAMRQNVGRLRRTLAKGYVDLFGFEPKRDLMIENRQAQGYRLDPGLRLRDPSDL